MFNPSGAEGTLPMGRADSGRGGRSFSSSSWVRALERLTWSVKEPTDGLRCVGCKVERAPGAEGSSFGNGGGRLASGAAVFSKADDALEFAREERVLVSILSSRV